MQENFLAQLKTETISAAKPVEVYRNCGVVQVIFSAAGIANGDNISVFLGGYRPKTGTLGLISNSNDSQLYHLRLNVDGTVNIITLGGAEISGAISAIGTLTFIADV